MYSPTDVAFVTPESSVEKVLTLDEYRDAIIRGGSKRGWTFEEVGPGHLLGNIAVRAKHFATVDITFDTTSYSIAHKSSQNLNYNEKRSEIHPNFNNWLEVLEDEIQAEIAAMKTR
jgi:hypothetical protein